MRTKLLIIVSAVVVLSENTQPQNKLRNFYDTYEDHARSTEQFLRNTVTNETHRVRHRHDEERRNNKIKRCRRYAQVYYQNYVPANCYYQVCRKQYCGYCPTSSCRRRCCGLSTPTWVTSPTPTRVTPPTAPIRECKCDKYGSKIQACDQITGKCICKPHYEGAKCDRCKLGYWKSKSLCTPCNCNHDGSISPHCDPETGLCPCKPGVQGPKCDSCEDKHYGNVAAGCKVCDPCDKEGHVCHPENGKCVCPKLTKGRKCEECVANAWGHEPGIGCKPCPCSPIGSSTQQCDSVTGRCTCRLGFEGEKCDKCSFGYYNYPNCRKCNCAVEGTRPEDCTHGTCKCSQNGCRCKDNVEGQYCDRCKKGTFGMDAEHPLGCIQCFCAHRSGTCTASSYIWDQIRTSEVRKSTARECASRRNCWSLPTKFSGDLMQSYGGYLRISSNSPRNFVNLFGNGVTLESVTDPRGDIKITETYWKLKYDAVPPIMPNECGFELTRPCLMVVLQNVTAIEIEPKSSSLNVKFNEVLLDKASNVPGVPQAKSVENCTCPEEYTSSSCQDPNSGYYRHYPKSEPQYTYIERALGVAKPCQCHNRSTNCDKKTGHCLNCGDFTTGPQCESCAAGFYKDPQGNCSPCLCPSETQNFASNCTILPNKQFICFCKPGYSGRNCNDCKDEYWGNPLKVQGSCQPCNCNPHGSENLRCDKKTGLCRCKPGFTGEKCAKCTSPRQVIDGGVCIPCDECTQILFYTLDNLSSALNETLDLFKNGLGPPWTHLNSTLGRYHLLTGRFDDLEKANTLIKNANIPELEEKIEKMKQDLSVRDQSLSTQKNKIDSMYGESTDLSKTVRDLDNNINAQIANINGFGKSDIDVDEALREAKELLRDIVEISREVPTVRQYQIFFDKCEQFYHQVDDLYRSDLNASRIKDDLKDLRNRISRLNEELNRTDQINKLARSKNKRNSNRIDVLKSRINEINANHSVINENIANLLKKINATNDLLRDVERIYEDLATMDLEEATNELDEDAVEEMYETLSDVRNHVKNLQNKIRTYKSLFNFTAEEWVKIDASGAYDNIAKGIEKARKEAEEARKITLDALKKLYPDKDDSLPDKTNLAKAFSDRIHKRVINLENLTEDFKKTTEDLEDLKHNILSNGKSNNELNSFLRNMLQNIGEQSKSIDRLSKAKNDAKNISSLITSIEQRIKDTNITVQYELTKTYRKYLDLLASSDIANLSSKINSTKEQLNKISISLNITYFDKVTDANKNKFKSNQMNLDAIKTQINQLDRVIQYANERVEAVDYGVDIRQCRRQYKLKNDILRSLEINFMCESCFLFKLANAHNETIQIYYENSRIFVDWKTQRISLSSNNTVLITRMGSRIQIKTENETQTLSDNEPFQIDSKHLLQVGNLSENNSKEACLRKIKFNGQIIGLWKFDTSEGTCAGCYRNNTNNDGLVNVFLNGNGYRKVLDNFLKRLDPSDLTFTFSFASFDENSLLFLAQDKTNQCSFIALNLKNGFLELNVRHVNGKGVTLTSEKKYNNGLDTTAEISMNYGDNVQTYSLKVLLPINETQNRPKSLARNYVYKIKKSEIFVGGISSTFNASCLPVNTTSFLGNIYVRGSLGVNSENSLSTNIEPRVDNLEFHKAWFPGEGFVNLEFDKPNSHIAFILKPVGVNNFVMNINEVAQIYVENSNLTFRVPGSAQVEFGTICANSYYFFNITESTVKVNDVKKDFVKADIFRDKLQLFLGNHNGNKNRRGFVGSISDISVDDRPLLFSTATIKSFAKVEIGRDRESAQTSCIKEMQNTERYFRAPDYKTEPQAFKFGDKPNSFVFIKNIPIVKKFVLEFQFRTFYPNGLLFMSNSRSNKNVTFFTVLEIQGGDVRLRVQGHRTKVMNISRKISDGGWHHVQVEQMFGKKKWRLVVKVDKKWKVRERTARNNFNGDLYLGGIASDLPVHKKLKNELHPFRGCIRSLKINKNLQIVKNNNNVFYNNIGQCFQNVEEGAYFGGDAFAVYKYGFKVNKFLELSFEFKTGEPNGILLSVANFGNSPALSVELQNGAVVMTIDMGNGIISQVTNSPHSDATLANNDWHNITALYSSSELTVNVDGIRKSWVQSDINSMIDEIEAPLYVGGLPSNAPSGTLKIKENFKGCIRKFKIEDNIMDWTDMKELNNVQLNSCLA